MQALEEQLAAGRRVAELAGELLALDTSELDAGLQRGLQRVGEIAAADRVSLLSLSPDEVASPAPQSWTAPGADRPRDDWRSRPHDFEWSLRRLSEGQIVHVHRLSDLPPEADPERKALGASGVRSYLAIPVLVEGHLVCHLDFERFEAEGDWSDDEKVRLELIARIFSSALRRKGIEEAAARSEERLRMLAGSARDVICEFGRDGRLVYVSPGIHPMLGYTAEEMLSLNVLDLLHPEDRHIMEAGLSEVVGREESVASLVRVLHRDGSLRWVEADGGLFETSSGEARMVLVAREVTAGMRKRAELEERLEVETLISDLSREFIGQGVDTLDDGIQRALRGAASIADADRAYLVSVPRVDGQPPNIYEWSGTVAPGWIQSLESDQMQRFVWMREQMLAGRVIAIPRVDEMPREARAEQEMLLANGVQSHLTIPVHTGEGLVGVVGFEYWEDTKEWDDRQLAVLRLVAELFTSALTRKRNEETRAEAQQFLEEQLEGEKRIAEISRQFLDLEPEQIAAGIQQKLPVLAELAGADHVELISFQQSGADAHEIYEWWSDELPPSARKTLRVAQELYPSAEARLLAGEVHQVSSLSALPEDAEAERLDLLERGVKSQIAIPLLSERRFVGMLAMECVREERDWHQETITLLRLAGQILVSAMRRMRTARELHESQTQLVQSQKMEAVGTLAGGIAHDFNNQLAVMLGNTRYVLESLEQQPELSAALVDIERAAEHCAQLTQGLLTFSRSTAVESLPLDVSRLMVDVRDLVAPLLPATISFELGVDDDLAWVCGDRTQLQQVLINLLVNARDALPKGGQLLLQARNCKLDAEEAASIGLGVEGDCVELIVEDDGLGMSSEVASRVFEPFFTTKDVGHGTGLGLATAYGIVQQIGGAIGLETEQGVGSKFRIVLPATGRKLGAEGASVELGDVPSGGTILLVEDEPAVRRVIGRMLRTRGFAVLEAGNGEEGLRIARSRAGELDLLVTDLTMPAMTGVDLARILVAEQPELPILFLSGRSDGVIEEAARELARADYLQKPFGEESLITAIRLLMRPAQGPLIR